MPVTIAALLPLLQARLNDGSDGQWTEEDKRQFINSARKRTVVQTKCYNTLQSVALTVGAAEYSADPVFEPLAVRLGDDLLTKVSLSSLPIITENWDALPAERPTKWTAMYGGFIRICPAPSAGYAGTISVYGPSYVTDLATDDTEITEIPRSHCEEVLLLAAEEEARRARPTMTGSVELAGLLHALWLEKCQDIRRVLGIVG